MKAVCNGTPFMIVKIPAYSGSPPRQFLNRDQLVKVRTRYSRTSMARTSLEP